MEVKTTVASGAASSRSVSKTTKKPPADTGRQNKRSGDHHQSETDPDQKQTCCEVFCSCHACIAADAMLITRIGRHVDGVPGIVPLQYPDVSSVVLVNCVPLADPPDALRRKFRPVLSVGYFFGLPVTHLALSLLRRPWLRQSLLVFGSTERAMVKMLPCTQRSRIVRLMWCCATG